MKTKLVLLLAFSLWALSCAIVGLEIIPRRVEAQNTSIAQPRRLYRVVTGRGLRLQKRINRVARERNCNPILAAGSGVYSDAQVTVILECLDWR